MKNTFKDILYSFEIHLLLNTEKYEFITEVRYYSQLLYPIHSCIRRYLTIFKKMNNYFK